VLVRSSPSVVPVATLPSFFFLAILEINQQFSFFLDGLKRYWSVCSLRSPLLIVLD